ncbi:MAG: hypothetical protein ACOCRX_06810 [Candidatus Woesearchaeota archaeon]
MIKKYNAFIDFIKNGSIVVEANNPKEAREKAYKKARNNKEIMQELETLGENLYVWEITEDDVVV